MKIIDIKKQRKEGLIPLYRLKDNIIFMEADKNRNPFMRENINNYFVYNVKSDEIKKVYSSKDKIVNDFFHQKEVEGEDAFYYLTEKKQLFLNDHTLYRVNMDSLKSEKIFSFSEEKRFTEFLIEKIDEKRFVVFFREEEKFDIENFENMDYGKEKYGFDKGTLYNIETGESFVLNDKSLLKGLKGVFFLTELKGEKVIIHEENYLETFQKEQIYMDIHMHKISKEDQFYYHDRLKYITLNKFIEEAEKGAEEFTFKNIEDYGYEGYELFIGSDEKNIIYQVETYGKEDSNLLMFLNRDTLDKKEILLKSLYDERLSLFPPSYFNYLDGREKYVFSAKFVSEEKVNLKEMLHNKIDYILDIKHGSLRGCIDNRYLILKKGESLDKTSVVDTVSNDIKSYNRKNTIFDDCLVLY